MQFYSKLIAVLFLLSIFFLSLQKQNVFKQTPNVITYDVYGYYLYLPAIFIFNETNNYDFVSQHFSQTKIASKPYQITTLPSGKKAPIYTGGMAILYSPFFFIADFYAKYYTSAPRDGISFPYQLGIIAATFFYVFLAVYYMQKTLVKLFSDKIAASVLVLVCFGTNFFHYTAFESGMPHTFLLGLYAPLLWFIISWHEFPDYRKSAIIGLLSGLICLARPSEAVLALLFVLYGVGVSYSFREKTTFLINNFSKILFIFFCGILVLLPQIAFWKINLGLWVFNGYEDSHFFDFFNPHLIDGLFSYRKGWLLYNPLMIFSLAGIFFLKKQKSEWFLPLLLFTGISIYIIFSWHMWWYSSSFGNRGIVQIYPVLAISLGSFLMWLQQKRIWSKLIFTVTAFCLLALNQFQDWQYRTRVLPLDGTTKLYYRKVFLKHKKQLPEDIRKYLYLDEELPTGEFISQPLLHLPDSLPKSHNQLITPDKEFCFSLKKKITENEAIEFSSQWVRITTKLKQFSSKYTSWKNLKLVLIVERKNETISWTGLPIQQFLKTGKLKKFQFEKQLPDLEAGDIIKTYFWNQSPDTIKVENLQADLLFPTTQNKNTPSQ